MASLFGISNRRGMMKPTASDPALSWEEGGKPKGRDFIGLALSGIGDALSNANGGQAWALPNMIAGRQSTRMEALRAASEAQAAERKRRAEREDKMWEWKNKPQDAQQPPANVQEALWWQNATPEQKTAFREANPTVYQTYEGPKIYGVDEYKDAGAAVPISQIMGGRSPQQQPMNAPYVSDPMNPPYVSDAVLQSFIGVFGPEEGRRRYNETIGVR